MSLYNQNDLPIISENWERIQTNVKKIRSAMELDPSLTEQQKIQQTIIDYAKTHKRKIYGGFGLNLLLLDKNPKDAIYEKDCVADIDMYSVDPISDFYKICNMLHKNGHKFVYGKEAMHQETYTILVGNCVYCDITYVPRNIYNKMPFKEINGLMVIHPNFMTIDYLRMFTDPIVSGWRIGEDLKAVKRFIKLQSNYPLQIHNVPINIVGSNPTLDIALEVVFDFIKDRKTIVNVGFYAYYYYLKESGFITSNTKESKKFKLNQVPFYEMISSEYRLDFFELMDKLKKHESIDKTKIKHVEYYPFFQFVGNSVEIYIGDDLIAKIYNNNKKCIPYKDVRTIFFKHKEYEEFADSIIRLGSFQLTLTYALINVMRTRVTNSKDETNLYNAVVSHLVEMRKYYFKNTKKNAFDNTPFEDFVWNCVGTTLTPNKQRAIIFEQRKKKKKKLSFNYNPNNGVQEPDTNYYFANSSGNEINNPKNLKLGSDLKDDDEEDAEET